MNRSRPLDNFSVIRSRDIEVVREAIAGFYAKPVLIPARGVKAIDATLNNCRMRHIELAYASFGAAVRLEYPETDFFSLLLPVRGKGEILSSNASAALSVNVGTMVPAHASHRVDYGTTYAHLVLRIKSQKLTEKLGALTGTKLGDPLRLDPQESATGPATHMLERYVPLLAATLSGAKSPFPDWWIEQTEQLLMTMILYSRRHNYSHLLEREWPMAASAQVRHAGRGCRDVWLRRSCRFQSRLPSCFRRTAGADAGSEHRSTLRSITLLCIFLGPVRRCCTFYEWRTYHEKQFRLATSGGMSLAR